MKTAREEVVYTVKAHEQGSKWGVRHLQAVLLFMLVSATTSVRTSLNIAVLAMSEKTNNSDVEIYDWDKEIHGYILSSASWGPMFVQVIAGVIVSHYGAKTFTLFSLIGTSILMLVTPWAASIGGWKGVCGAICLQGFSQGFIFPSIHCCLGRWAPIAERTRLGMFVYSGMSFGMIISPPIAALIGTSSFGWPWIFYYFGAQTLICAILWWIYGSNSPSNCKRISKNEKKYIEESLDTADTKYPAKTPWKSILTSVPFYALLCTQIGGTWGFMVIYNETTSYFNLALGIELQDSGLLTSLGYVNAICFTYLTSYIADYLFNKNCLSITHIRKLFNTCGTWGPAICFILLVLVPSDQKTPMIVLMIMMAGLDGINNCGFLVNHIDLSPRYAGILVGIASSITDGICLLAPLTTGYIVGDDSKNITKWRYVFMIAAGMYFFGNIVFLCFGSGEKQPWNNFQIEKNKSKDKDLNDISIELMEKCAKKESLDIY